MKKPAKKQVAPVLPQPPYWLSAKLLYEAYPLSRMVRKSYVLSRFWAWFSKIEVEPKLKVPVPRFLTVRDP